MGCYDIFFFDIDGTLRSFRTGEIPLSAREAIVRLRQQGKRVLLATGRGIKELQGVKALQGMTFDGYILVNGGYCLTAEGEVLAEHTLSEELLDRMLRIGEQESIPVAMLTREGLFIDRVNDSVREFLTALDMNPNPATSDLREVVQRVPCQQLCVFLSPERERHILPLFPELEASRWSPLMADFNLRGIDKATGVASFLRHYAIAREHAMAFGDGGNDVPMIRYAGVGVAMGNAVSEARQVADYVTGSVDDDGIVQALRHYHVLK
jgi:hypothetical protein